MSTPPRDPEDPRDETVVREEWDDDHVVVEEEEVVPRRRSPLIWPWLLLLLLLVLGGLGAYYYFSQEDTNTVPSLIGEREEPAEGEVREAGFEPQSERVRHAKPLGVVVGQRPEAGTELEEGETVLLTVSNGPPRDTVPDVVGQTRSEATADLAAASFEAEVTEAFSDKKAGIVIEQDPEAGTNLKEGSSVALTVSKGRRPVEVPDVVGTTTSEATATLREAGLEVNLVPVPSREPRGTVLAQSPPPGTTAKAGTKVRLNVAQADAPPPATTQTTTTTTTTATTATTTTATTPPPTQPPATSTVPDAVGQELAVGARTFADEGLKLAVRYVPSQEPQGRIVAQARPSGSELRRGDTVQVNVSNGPDPAAATDVPDVDGLSEAEARSRLVDAGFEVLVIRERALGGSRVGVVGSQSPSGGASVPRGSLVILYAGA